MNKLIQKQKNGLLAMAFILLPAMLHAQDANQIYVTDSGVSVRAGTNVCEIVGDKEYADLGDALVAVKNNQTIRLLQNINYQRNFQSDSYGIRIEGKSITFDLNGFNLNVEIDDGAALVVTGAGSEVKLAGKGELNVTSKGLGGAGVVAQYGGKATVTNAIGGGGAEAHNNSTVTVLGNTSSTEDNFGYGIYASNNSIVTVYGNATGYNCGVRTRSNATVTVYGNVTIATSSDVLFNYAIYADGNANVIIEGDVTGKYYGVYAINGSTVKVTGDVAGNNYGVIADSSSNVTIMGDAIGGSIGVSTSSNATVTVSGSVTGIAREGIHAIDGSKISVTGSVTGGTMIHGYGVYARDNNTTVTVSSDVTGHQAVVSYKGSSVTVKGDVIANATTDVNYSNGVGTSENASVTISGNVSGHYGIYIMNNEATVTIGGDVSGVRAGVYIQENCSANITIDGLIKVPDDGWFIGILTPWTQGSFIINHLLPTDNQLTSTKPGYLEYTDDKNYVWVKGGITGTDNIQQSSSTLKASTQDGRLHVSGLTVGDLWTVYNLSGAIVYQNRATAEEAVINLPAKGLYIIVSAGQSVKTGNF